MRLSGWARLWIVTAVLIWLGGAWFAATRWPRERFVPHPVMACNFYNSVDSYLGSALVAGCRSHNDVAWCEREYQRCLTEANSATQQANFELELKRARTEYAYDVAELVIPVALTPFLLGLLGLLTLRASRWIGRGFDQN